MKIRIFINKYSNLKFLSHLDFLRFIERFLLRAGIEFKYSQGYNKRIKISFGPAAGFGMELYNEPIDMQVASQTDLDIIKKLLNNEIVSGFCITSLEILENKESIAKDYSSQIYEVEFLDNDLKQLVSKDLENGILSNKFSKLVKYEIGVKIILCLDLMSPKKILLDYTNEKEKFKITRIGYLKF